MIWEALKHWERHRLFIRCFTSIYIVNFLYWKTCIEINPECPSHWWPIKTLSTLTGGRHSSPTPKGETFGLYNAFTHLQTKETLRNFVPSNTADRSAGYYEEHPGPSVQISCLAKFCSWFPKALLFVYNSEEFSLCACLLWNKRCH